MLSVFGKLPQGADLERIQQSPNYKNGSFQNLNDTPMMAPDASYWKLTKLYFKKQVDPVPLQAVPSVQTNLRQLSDEAQLVWFGHSSYLLKVQGLTFLLDPVFSGSASPFSFLVKNFKGANVYGVDEMPDIDYLVLSHDHYDHLDYKTVKALKSKVKKVICALGVGAHLKHWGYEASKITELDWWDEYQDENGVKLTATPARHFSGRLFKRGQSFWNSYVLQLGASQIYIGGDSGYDEHFKLIGERFGYFDVAILECGQYNKMWQYIHMMPEEVAQAGIDLKAAFVIPVHWGKFKLALHPWQEPITRLKAAAEQHSVRIEEPVIGRPITIEAKSRRGN